MASGYTIFTTYQFEGAEYSPSNSFGYHTAVHCNYIQKTETDSLAGKSLGLFFTSADDFPFLADSGSTNGTGFTATKINALVQVVEGISTSGTTISPDPTKWKKFDITSQIQNHVIGQRIDKTKLVSTLFSIDFNASAEYYDLSYLNYPTALANDDEKLCFGEEVLFFGTVETDIKATAFTTEIPVVLPLNQYNSTTNSTWDGSSQVYITEIGIYDSNNNLVAIGKLSQPISKDSTIARTILFAIDF